MSARLVFAALAALFARPHVVDASQLAPIARVQEQDGLVSEASAFRIRTAFARFARFVRGGG